MSRNTRHEAFLNAVATGSDVLDTEKIFAVTIHPTLPILAMGTESSCVKLYHLRLNKYVDVLPQVGIVYAVQFSPCGNFLATAASSNEQESYRISLWDVNVVNDGIHYGPEANVEFVLRCDDSSISDSSANMSAKLHQANITCLAFRPCLKDDDPCFVLASGSRDQTVRFWHFAESSYAPSEMEDGDFKMTRLIDRVHNGEVTAVAFADQGRVMASCAADKNIIVRKFQRETAYIIHQSSVFNLVTELPYALQFYPTHQLYENPKGAPLRAYKFMCGTDTNLHMFEVKDTFIPLEVPVVEFEQHLAYGVETDDHAAERFERQHSARINSMKTNVVLRTAKSFRTQALYDEPHWDEDDSSDSPVHEINNIVQLAKVQTEPVKGGVRTLVADNHVSVYDQSGGAMYTITGTGNGKVIGHTWASTKQESNKPYFHTPVELDSQMSALTCVAVPSRFLIDYFQDTRDGAGLLEADQYFCVTASIDETVKIFTVEIAASADYDATHQFYFKLPDEQKRKPVVLQRLMTEHHATEVFALSEQVRQKETEQKLKSEEESEADMNSLALGREQAYSSLLQFRLGAMIDAGKMPKEIQPGGEAHDPQALTREGTVRSAAAARGVPVSDLQPTLSQYGKPTSVAAGSGLPSSAGTMRGGASSNAFNGAAGAGAGAGAGGAYGRGGAAASGVGVGAAAAAGAGGAGTGAGAGRTGGAGGGAAGTAAGGAAAGAGAGAGAGSGGAAGGAQGAKGGKTGIAAGAAAVKAGQPLVEPTTRAPRRNKAAKASNEPDIAEIITKRIEEEREIKVGTSRLYNFEQLAVRQHRVKEVNNRSCAGPSAQNKCLIM